MAYAKLKYEKRDGVAIISLADATSLNAISDPMAHELRDALNRAQDEVRSVVLTGEGRAFSSGANLSSGDLPRDAEGNTDLGLHLKETMNPMIATMRDLRVPIVTAVNGAAAGIGCSVALMGDLIVAGESAYFLQAFRRIGLVPDGSATYHLPRMVTRARAMEMMLLGERLPAPKALEWGLINRCVPDAEVLPTAIAFATELAAGPTKALGMIRKLGWQSLDANWDEQLTAECDAQRTAGRSEDFTEGVRAFLEKRPAKFTGA